MIKPAASAKGNLYVSNRAEMQQEIIGSLGINPEWAQWSKKDTTNVSFKAPDNNSYSIPSIADEISYCPAYYEMLKR